MAAYAYKEVFHRPDYQAAIKPCMEALGQTEAEYDGDPNYDGDGWYVTAFLLDQKDAEIAPLKAEIESLKARDTQA